MNRFFVKYTDGSHKIFAGICHFAAENITEYTLESDIDYKKAEYVDYFIHNYDINSKDEGYFLVSGGNGNCISRDFGICYFKEREDSEYLIKSCFMPVLGIKHKDNCSLAIVSGMGHDISQYIKIKDGRYYIAIRIFINGELPYENIKIRLYTLYGDDSDYSGMARTYRRYQLSRGFVPLKDKLTPELKYSVESQNIRIRMGWKPVPCVIHEQTEENEPPMHVACTFDDVIRLMEAYKRAGIESAEFCLVGWNIKGHDGRWPQILPPESTLGGYDGLKKVIEKGKELGYAVTCHTNSTDAYTIANIYSDSDIAILKNGEKDSREARWGGGRTYCICPKKSYELFKKTLPEVAALGFKGMHYIDVITCLPPKVCHSHGHPVNAKESCEYFDRLFLEAKELFGSVGSEAAYDHSLKNCDYALYVSFADFLDEKSKFALCDKAIPFFQLVYHGIVPSNPYSRTVNPLLSDKRDDLLKLIEFGGMPQIYYYARFVDDGTNWIGGGNDFRCNTDEDIAFSTELVKKSADIYDEIKYLQYEFMQKHEEISPGVFVTTYSDGSTTTVDYNNKTYKLQKA